MDHDHLFRVYNQEMETLDPQEQHAVVDLVDQWEERGEARGRREGETTILLRLLSRKFGSGSRGCP